jgi:hypothetical protein
VRDARFGRGRGRGGCRRLLLAHVRALVAHRAHIGRRDVPAERRGEGIFGDLVSRRTTRRLRGKRDLGPRGVRRVSGFGSADADPGGGESRGRLGKNVPEEPAPVGAELRLDVVRRPVVRHGAKPCGSLVGFFVYPSESLLATPRPSRPSRVRFETRDVRVACSSTGVRCTCGPRSRWRAAPQRMTRLDTYPRSTRKR